MLLRSWIIWMSALGICFIAVIFSILDNGSICTNSTSSICTIYHFFGFYNIAWRLDIMHLIMKKTRFIRSGTRTGVFPYRLLWMAPFISGGGYCSEALSFILGLETSKLVPFLTIEQHGDLANELFWKGLPINAKNILIKSYKPGLPLNDTVVICHSEPGAWYPPLFETNPCPPTGYDEPMYVIGRTMFETDRVTPEHVARCNKMDEVWVPSDFNLNSFVKSGVLPSKLVKVVQSVDVSFFNPQRVKATYFPATDRVYGPPVTKQVKTLPKDCYVFLSIFKWELRKGWDVLIRAYLSEFSAKDNVALYILTNAYHTERIYEDKIKMYVKSLGLDEPEYGWPVLHVSDDHVPQSELPSFYKSANAFVLPSRGEGWGRPHVEAMSMGLPVIATNWSGMTEYMTESNSYPLEVDKLVEVQEGPFKGHLWAEPSSKHLRFLMRHVFSHPYEAKTKGFLARKTMVERFSPEVVSEELVRHLIRVGQTKSRSEVAQS